jgi:predicted AlkP superfamily phosphohydrolase/phosphomutase
MTQPLILVAVNGLSLPFLERILGIVKLPTLARLWEEGTSGELKGPIQPAETVTWANLLTGTDAGRHGVVDDIQRQPGTYQFIPANGRHLRAPTFWQIAADYGLRIGLLNVPLLYPPQSIDGYLVAGNDSPSYRSPFTYPNGIAPLLAQKLGGTYQFDRELTTNDLEQAIQHTQQLQQARIDSYVILEEKFKQLDLRMVAFSAIGHLMISFWSEIEQAILDVTATSMPTWMERFLGLFRQLDSFVGEVLRQSGGETGLVLLSTWSIGHFSGTWTLNNWLVEKGYLTPKSVTTVESFPNGIDWSKTLAYAPSQWGSLYLNIRGREPQGIIEPGYEATNIKMQLKRELGSLQSKNDPNPLVTALYTNEELYTGPLWNEAPDLNIILRDYSVLTTAWPGSGCSRPDGFFLYHGPGTKGHKISSRPIEDVAPTMLQLLGLSIPDMIKGDSFACNLANLGKPEIRAATVSELTSVSILQAKIEELEKKHAQAQAVFKAAQANGQWQTQKLEKLETELETTRRIIAGYQAGRVMRFLLWLTRLKRRVLKGM